MKRRHFLQTTIAAGAVAGLNFNCDGEKSVQIPKRKYNDQVDLSIIGFGGIVVCGMEQTAANQVVADSVQRGVNYFDVAPTYFDGEAEIKLGIALKPFRKDVFLACKTTQRDAEGAQMELERSLQRLHTDYFDLYQFHAVTTMEDVEKIWAPGGAAEIFINARQQGKIKHIGLSAHSEEAALAMFEKIKFDSILFPINFVCYSQGNFGSQVIKKAKENGIALLALKAMAFSKKIEELNVKYPKCWYKPVDEEKLARKALQFTLAEGVTAMVPPGDERLYEMALKLAPTLDTMSNTERQELIATAAGVEPIFRTA